MGKGRRSLIIVGFVVWGVVFSQTRPSPALPEPAPNPSTLSQPTTIRDASVTAARDEHTPQPTLDNTPGERKVVDFKADIMRPVKIGDSSVINLLGNVVFYHNGAVITCDSAIRYNEKRMECFKRVVVNKQKTYIYGDRADYNGETNTANVYAPIIKLVDDDAVMYTYNMSYNTLSGVAQFSGGATITQKENMLESSRGYYFTKLRELVCVERVQIKNPDYKIKSDSIMYNMDSETATFYVPTTIWNSKGEILNADMGQYFKENSRYYFTKNSHALTKEQELWADTIDFNSLTEDAILYNNIQLRDEENKVMAFGDFGQYWGKREEMMLTKKPSLVTFDPAEDSLFMRSDSMFLYTKTRVDMEAMIAKPVVASGEDELMEEQVVADSVGALSVVGSPVVADTAKVEEKKKGLFGFGKGADKKVAKPSKRSKKSAVGQQLAVADSIFIAPIDSVVAPVAKVVVRDTVVAHVDTLKKDSLVRIVKAYRNVKIFRTDFQAVCDSLVGFSIDSTLHMYHKPVLWNLKNQIQSELVDVYTKNQKLDKAIFTGVPIMSSELDTTHYNQVKGKVIEVVFVDGEIKRTDVNGNAQTLYYATDQEIIGKDTVEVITGFSAVESANITFQLDQKRVKQIIYRGNPKYWIYPLDKIPADQPTRLEGFTWEGDRRPTKDVIFSRNIRPSRRAQYEAMPLPQFPLTISIKGHIERMIKDGTWRDRNDKLNNDVIDFINSLTQ